MFKSLTTQHICKYIIYIYVNNCYSFFGFVLFVIVVAQIGFCLSYNFVPNLNWALNKM